MSDDPDTETIEVPIQFLKLQAQEDPDLVLPASRATCPRCGVTGWAAGQSGCSVADAIDAMVSDCRGREPWNYDYVPEPGTEPPDDLVPA